MKRDLEIAALANKAVVANGQVDGHWDQFLLPIGANLELDGQSF